VTTVWSSLLAQRSMPWDMMPRRKGGKEGGREGGRVNIRAGGRRIIDTIFEQILKSKCRREGGRKGGREGKKERTFQCPGFEVGKDDDLSAQQLFFCLVFDQSGNDGAGPVSFPAGWRERGREEGLVFQASKKTCFSQKEVNGERWKKGRNKNI